MFTPIRYTLKDGTAQLTHEQVQALFTPEELTKGRGKLCTVHPERKIT